MAFSYCYKSNYSSFVSDYWKSFESGSSNVGGVDGVLQSQSLVLDSKRGELVKAPAAKVGKKGVSEAKAMAALKNHSEAERRRRERINAHLDALRCLVPCTEKMDKATLLGEVIDQVRELKKNAMEASKGLVIPLDADEVKVEPYDDYTGCGNVSVRATLCCDYRPELLSNLRQTLDTLHLKVVNAEISTLGGRVKNVLILTRCKDINIDDANTSQLLATSVHQAITSILDKASVLPDYSPRTTRPCKRQRLAFFDSSSSSS